MASDPTPEANAASWLERHAEERPHAEALVDAWRRLDYDGLASRVARCAGVLAAAGVGSGDRVALLMGNHAPYLEGVFAAARLGAMAVPVNVRWSPREIAVLLDDCTPRAVLHDAERQAVRPNAAECVRRAECCLLSRVAVGHSHEKPVRADRPPDIRAGGNQAVHGRGGEHDHFRKPSRIDCTPPINWR